MGLFKMFTNHVKEQSVLDWLQEADRAYNFALQSHKLNATSNYFVGEALSFISTLVNSQNAQYQGLDRYRHANFELLQETDATMLYRKSVIYDNVKITHGVIVPIGDAYVEHWWVTKESTPYKIRRIRRVSD